MNNKMYSNIFTWILLQSRFFFLSLLPLFFFLFSSLKITAQDSDAKFGLLNIATGGVVGGIGALINKEPEESFYTVLGKGFAQGALGGYLVFESKRMLTTFVQQENYTYVWPSKILNSAGTSIIENAASNKDFWENWHITLGFTRFDINIKDNVQIRYRVMPFSLLRAIQLQTISRNVDWNKSMKLGVLVFIRDEHTFRSADVDGSQASNHISLKKDSAGIEIEAHEILHVYQNNQFSGLNPYFNKINSSLQENSKIYGSYQKIFYTDFNSPIFRGLYKLGRSKAGSYEENIFEREAYFFAR
jgi:hypothetical protein